MKNSSSHLKTDRERTVWLRLAADVCEQAAKGNLEPRLLNAPTEGDLGRLLHGINHLLDMTDAFVRECGACLDTAARGRFYRRIILRGMQGGFVRAAKNANNATAAMARQSAALAEMDRKRSVLVEELSHVVSALSTSAAEVRQTADALAAGARSTSDVSSEVSSAADQTSSTVETVSAATEELNVTFAEVEKQTLQSEELARTAVADAARTSENMHELAKTSQKIGGVIRLVAQIAAQTKLLALNANIEAARSGVAGRGFAVVAAEVKNLAQRTAEATEEITEGVSRIQTATDGVAGAIQLIGNRVNEMSDISGAIARSVTEQRRASSEISAGLHNASGSTRSVSRQIHTVRENASTTSEYASSLLNAAAALTSQSTQVHDVLSELVKMNRS